MAQEIYNLGPQDADGYDSHFQTHTKHIANIADHEARIVALYDELVAPVQQFNVAAGQTLPITRATHQCASITLAGAGSTVSFSATAQGNGFAFTIYNETGADWTIPTFTGGTNRYPKNVAHTKLESGGVASFEVITQNGQLRVRINGDTA